MSDKNGHAGNGANGHHQKKKYPKTPVKANTGRRRPTKLTPSFLKQVEELAALGMNQRQIADVLSVGEMTMSMWKRERNDLEVKFVKALKKGEAAGIRRRLRRIELAGEKGSWQADAWTLERRHPDQFAKRDNVRVGDPDGKPLAPVVVAPTVTFVQPSKEEADRG